MEEDIKINKTTKEAGLLLNVSIVKKWLRNFYEKNYYESHKKINKDYKIRFINAHYVITASEQVIIIQLLNLFSNKVKKSKTGLYEITEDQIIDAIKLDDDFNFAFNRFYYDENIDYTKELGYKDKIINEFIEKYCFDGGNVNISISLKALNMISFILVQTRIMLGNIGYFMMNKKKDSKNGTVNGKIIFNGISLYFNGKLRDKLLTKIETVLKTIKDKSKKNNEEIKKSDNKHEKNKNKNKKSK